MTTSYRLIQGGFISDTCDQKSGQTTNKLLLAVTQMDVALRNLHNSLGELTNWFCIVVCAIFVINPSKTASSSSKQIELQLLTRITICQRWNVTRLWYLLHLVIAKLQNLIGSTGSESIYAFHIHQLDGGMQSRWPRLITIPVPVFFSVSPVNWTYPRSFASGHSFIWSDNKICKEV